MIHYVLFSDQMPSMDQDGSFVVAAYPGREPFILHWPTDEEHVEQQDCMWLKGARIPRVPQPHEVGRQAA